MRLAREAVDDALRLVESAERLATKAEWLLDHGHTVYEARDGLERAWRRLVQADRRKWVSNRYLRVAAYAACLEHKRKDPFGKFIHDTQSNSSKAFSRIDEIYQRLVALIARFHAEMVILSSDVLAAERLRHFPKHPRPADELRFDHQQHRSSPTPACAEGFRRVTRGRAPPRNRTACLHAVPAAAEEPVCLRSLS
jgi:hypothetical protein